MSEARLTYRLQSHGLTRREQEVLAQASRGLSVVESGHETHHTPETVKFHRYNAFRKLGARNIAHAVSLARERGLIGDPSDNGWGCA